MKDEEIQLQILYEIAMSIGNSLDMKKMLQESLSTYLRKFNLAAGVVLQGNFIEDELHFEPIFAIPRKIHQNETYIAAMANIPSRLPVDQIEANIERLPLSGQHGAMHYHIMELPGFGLLVLLKSRTPIDALLLKTMQRINKKLAVACRSCLRKGHIQKIAADLKLENKIRKTAEIALAEAHERLLTVLNSLDVLIYVADLEHYDLVFMNRRMEKIFGKNLHGRRCYEVFHGGSAPCLNCSNDQLLSPDGLPLAVKEWEDRNRLTHKWYMHQIRAIKWIDGRWVRLRISTDISKLKELEQDRIQEAHLRQTQRLEALGILAGGVAHEYNNLLMSMLGNLSLMKFKIDDGDPLLSYTKKIEQSIRTAANLTDKLLGYAQKGRYENIKLQLNALIDATITEFSKSHESIGLHLSFDKELHQIEADQRQIEHVLWNLFTNAADAMPDGGDLYIATRNVKRQDLKDKPYAIKREDYIELSVKDNGIGMTPEIRDHIFDPFYTTKPMTAGKGVGLGMAATYGIVKAHEGFIEVTSNQGEGSQFVIYLPVIEESDTEAPSDEERPEPSKTVLLADDEEASLFIGSQILRQLGYEVIEAESGEAAIAQFKDGRDRIDVVILDMVMPGITGVEAFEQIKADFPEARIVLASGYLVDDEARRLMKHGAEGFVKKPFVIDELHQAVEKAADPRK